MAHDVFISYSFKDRTVADAVCAILERQGIRCWIAPRDIGAADTWAGAIARAINTCRIFVLIVSSSSNLSPDCLRELSNAASRGKPILPLRVEATELSDELKYYLTSVHWLDALTEPRERQIEALAERVAGLLGPVRGPGPVEDSATDAEAEPCEDEARRVQATAPEPTPATVDSRPPIAVRVRRSVARYRWALISVCVVCILSVLAALGPRIWQRGGTQDDGESLALEPAAEGVSQPQTPAEPASEPITAPPPRASVAKMRPGRRAGQETEGPDGGTYVWVPAGEFMMGSEDGDDDEKPVHEVRITRGFWIGKHEVTNEQYRRYCEATGKTFPSGSNQGDDHPVVNVSWNDAKAYCDHYGLVLPTEAQWEYAARGRDASKYPWGNEWEVINCCSSGNKGPGHQTYPVGSFPLGTSWCGALDMAGNVWEWCADWYDVGYYGKSPFKDPTGPVKVGWRSLRGGSWDGYAVFCRGADRHRYYPEHRYSHLGFRAARTP